MKIFDHIYGELDIKERVILELMKSAPMQRLERINQHGIPKKYCIYSGFSRYEHSVGVLFLLRKLKANCEEQVAGLLHNISHTAFSHVIE